MKMRTSHLIAPPLLQCKYKTLVRQPKRAGNKGMWQRKWEMWAKGKIAGNGATRAGNGRLG